MKDKKLDRLIAWLIDWLAGWLVDWLTDCLTGSGLIDCMLYVCWIWWLNDQRVSWADDWMGSSHIHMQIDISIDANACDPCLQNVTTLFISGFYFHADFSDCLHISSHMFKFAQTSYLQLLLCGQESFCNCVESLEGASVDSCLKMGCRGCAWLWYIVSPRTQLSAVWLFLVC